MSNRRDAKPRQKLVRFAGEIDVAGFGRSIRRTGNGREFSAIWVFVNLCPLPIFFVLPWVRLFRAGVAKSNDLIPSESLCAVHAMTFTLQSAPSLAERSFAGMSNRPEYQHQQWRMVISFCEATGLHGFAQNLQEGFRDYIAIGTSSAQNVHPVLKSPNKAANETK